MTPYRFDRYSFKNILSNSSTINLETLDQVTFMFAQGKFADRSYRPPTKVDKFTMILYQYIVLIQFSLFTIENGFNHPYHSGTSYWTSSPLAFCYLPHKDTNCCHTILDLRFCTCVCIVIDYHCGETGTVHIVQSGISHTNQQIGAVKI